MLRRSSFVSNLEVKPGWSEKMIKTMVKGQGKEKWPYVTKYATGH